MLGNISKEVKDIVKTKKIWPFPSAADGGESGFEERAAICKKEKYQIWQSKKVEEQGQAWRLLNGKFIFHVFNSYLFLNLGIDPTTGSSDASTSETSESEAPEEEEEDDEV